MYDFIFEPKTYNQLLNYACIYYGDRFDAEDSVQFAYESFLKRMKKFDFSKIEGDTRRYIYKCLINGVRTWRAVTTKKMNKSSTLVGDDVFVLGDRTSTPVERLIEWIDARRLLRKVRKAADVFNQGTVFSRKDGAVVHKRRSKECQNAMNYMVSEEKDLQRLMEITGWKYETAACKYDQIRKELIRILQAQGVQIDFVRKSPKIPIKQRQDEIEKAIASGVSARSIALNLHCTPDAFYSVLRKIYGKDYKTAISEKVANAKNKEDKKQ